MFSLISLYFAYRRDVVQAERFLAALDNKAVPVIAAAPVAAPIEMVEFARAA